MNTLSRRQIRAALGLLGISTAAFCEDVGLTRAPVVGYLNGKKELSLESSNAIYRYFSNKRVVFGDNHSVSLLPPEDMITMYGRDGFRALMDDVYKAAADGYNEFRIQNARPENWYKHLGVEWYGMHAQRMKVLADARAPGDEISFKISTCEGDDYQIASSFAQYRWVKKDMFTDQSIYIYGDNVAFLFFGDDVKVFNIRSADIVHTMRNNFDFFWQHNTFDPDLAPRKDHDE